LRWVRGDRTITNHPLIIKMIQLKIQCFEFTLVCSSSWYVEYLLRNCCTISLEQVIGCLSACFCRKKRPTTRNQQLYLNRRTHRIIFKISFNMPSSLFEAWTKLKLEKNVVLGSLYWAYVPFIFVSEWLMLFYLEKCSYPMFFFSVWVATLCIPHKLIQCALNLNHRTSYPMVNFTFVIIKLLVEDTLIVLLINP
jgi:hypothetical protein